MKRENKETRTVVHSQFHLYLAALRTFYRWLSVHMYICTFYQANLDSNIFSMGNSGYIQKYAAQAWLHLPVQLNKIYKFIAGSKQLRFFFSG
jgi:hypothetical protein